MKKYLIIALPLLLSWSCKSTYHTTSDDYVLWTKHFQIKKGITDEEMKDQDNVRVYNELELRLRTQLSPDEYAEYSKNVSSDHGNHFDKGDLMEGGYKYVTVPAHQLGVILDIKGDTMFVKFSEENPIVFTFIKNAAKGQPDYYRNIPLTDYVTVFDPGGKKILSREYDPRSRTRITKYITTRPGYVKQPVSDYVMYEGRKYEFFVDEKGMQYAKSKIVVSRKMVGDTYEIQEGIPVPN